MAVIKRATIKQFAVTLAKMGKSDRYNLMGVGGFMGEGKSCFLTQLADEYSKLVDTPYKYSENITWLRDELLEWVDGKNEDKTKQKSEYSAIVADEFISMFYKRNWYKEGQKDAVELFNKIRDRHLFIGGAIPNFWDLDKGLLANITYYVFIPERGRAWVFDQENNPFATDTWNVDANRKLFRKSKTPYKCPNFVVEILFNDWTPKDKERYYKIRNTKRINTEGQNREKNNTVTSRAVKHRNDLLKYSFDKKLLGKKELLKLVDVTPQYLNRVLKGQK